MSHALHCGAQSPDNHIIVDYNRSRSTPGHGPSQAPLSCAQRSAGALMQAGRRALVMGESPHIKNRLFPFD